MLLRELEPEKYFSFPSSFSTKMKRDKLDAMIASGQFYYSEKIDGNWTAFVYDFDEEKRLITRGISKQTGEYGRIEGKVFFFDALSSFFTGPTKILGETYLDNGIDRNVGSILRAKDEKAKSIQSNDFYNEIKSKIKFSTKDKRDIEQNEFKDQKLKFYAFDILFYNGQDLSTTPWIKRQEILAEVVEKIDCELISVHTALPMDNDFYNRLNNIFEQNGEGVVIINGNSFPEPGARTAWKTLKVKQELSSTIDCFVYDIEVATKDYTGKELETWQYWLDIRTGQVYIKEYYNEYINGQKCIIPITKNYANGWCGAVKIGVFDDEKNIIPIGKVAGLTDEDKEGIRNNWSDYFMRPLTISGMMISQANENIRIRHPIIKSWRDGDINADDCTLAKIIG